MTDAKIVDSLVEPDDDIRVIRRKGAVVLVEVVDLFHKGTGEPDIERWTPSNSVADLVHILCDRSYRLGFAAGVKSHLR